VYGPADDVPDYLRKLYSATSDNRFEAVLHDLMSAIFHQHDATTAAFAVAPHFETMMRERPSLRLACVEAIALIEAARQNSARRRGREVAVPEDLREDYAATVARLPQMIGACSDLPWERHQCFLFAGTLLAAKGHAGWVEELGELGMYSGLNCPECGKFIDIPRRNLEPAEPNATPDCGGI
jgi:hypothetical protein